MSFLSALFKCPSSRGIFFVKINDQPLKVVLTKNRNYLLRLLGFVVVHININHIPKATPNPIHGVFIDNAAKKPTVAMMQVIKNQITFFIVSQI